jgi:hypothetical protein
MIPSSFKLFIPIREGKLTYQERPNPTEAPFEGGRTRTSPIFILIRCVAGRTLSDLGVCVSQLRTVEPAHERRAELRVRPQRAEGLTRWTRGRPSSLQ